MEWVQSHTYSDPSDLGKVIEMPFSCTLYIYITNRLININDQINVHRSMGFE